MVYIRGKKLLLDFALIVSLLRNTLFMWGMVLNTLLLMTCIVIHFLQKICASYVQVRGNLTLKVILRSFSRGSLNIETQGRETYDSEELRSNPLFTHLVKVVQFNYKKRGISRPKKAYRDIRKCIGRESSDATCCALVSGDPLFF